MTKYLIIEDGSVISRLESKKELEEEINSILMSSIKREIEICKAEFLDYRYTPPTKAKTTLFKIKKEI